LPGAGVAPVRCADAFRRYTERGRSVSARDMPAFARARPAMPAGARPAMPVNPVAAGSVLLAARTCARSTTRGNRPWSQRLWTIRWPALPTNPRTGPAVAQPAEWSLFS